MITSYLQFKEIQLQVQVLMLTSHYSLLCEELCECVCGLSKCMCFLLGRCFPILWALHHTATGEQIWGRGGEGGGEEPRPDWSKSPAQCDKVLSVQRKSREDPEFPELSETLHLSHLSNFATWKWDACFYRSRLCPWLISIAPEREFGHEIKQTSRLEIH